MAAFGMLRRCKKESKHATVACGCAKVRVKQGPVLIAVAAVTCGGIASRLAAVLVRCTAAVA